MFAETAIVDYRLLFADQGKQYSVFHFRFPFAVNNRNCRFPFAEFRKLGDMDMETLKLDWETYVDMIHGIMEKWRHGDISFL